MKFIYFIIVLGLLNSISLAQSTSIVEKRNVYTKKGDFFFEKKDYDKAILFYNMAYQKDNSDYLSILKRAEAYTALKMYAQAEETYRIIFDKGLRPNNTYKLEYALVLLKNGKPDEFKHWINEYQQIVDVELSSVSEENRVKLYKDTAIVLGNETVEYKIKYAAYKMKRSPKPEDKQLNIILSNGNDHYVSPKNESDFEFSFKPQEPYTLKIRKENIASDDVIGNKLLTGEDRDKQFLQPGALQETEISLEPGMKYQFMTGQGTVSADYMNALRQLVGDYQSGGDDAVDLTAIVKELHMEDDAVYSIHFEKGKARPGAAKKPEISSLTVNGQDVNIFGNSFFIVLPLETGVNFNVQTDIDALKESFSSKKFALNIDDAPVFTGYDFEEPIVALSINTASIEGIKSNNTYMGREVGMIPGTEYILTLSKLDPITEEPIEIIVPLTKGVKYNFTSLDNEEAFKEELAEFLVASKNIDLSNEEVINISMLSKALELKKGEKISFHLKPAKKFGKAPTTAVSSNLMIDDKVFTINSTEKFRVNIPFEVDQKLNIQTDIGYVKENFANKSYVVRLDTTSFLTEIIIDTTGFNALRESGWLSMSVNTDNVNEVSKHDHFIARDVSILPGKEYILTVSRTDAETGKTDEIIIPMLRDVKYDFTANEEAADDYDKELEEFMAGNKEMQTTEGTMIDIKLLSKELQIKKGDEVSFSLLPVKNIYKKPETLDVSKSSLFLDQKVVEFTHIHKYSINMPLTEGQMNVQTNLEHIQQNFDPGTVNFEMDTASFFSEITVDTNGLGDRVIKDKKITDPVFDVVTVNFDVNQHALTDKAKQIIQQKAVNELKADSRLYVTITGYTDALGDADYNMKLSQKRAESVQAYLKANGIGDSRIRTFSFGESKTLAVGVNWEDLSEAELAKHRKVEIVIYLPK